MKNIISYLKTGLVCLLVVSSVLSVAREMSQARKLVKTDAEFFQLWEKRFEPIKKDLPFTYGVIGYVGDWDVPGLDYDRANTELELILTQYALTPIVVTRDTGHEWILVNLSATDFDTWLGVQEEDFEVTRYKYSLYLLRRIK